MSLLGLGKSKTKSPTPTTVHPVPTTEDISVEARRKSEDERRRLQAMVGRRGTILTGTLGEPLSGKQTLLGRT